MAFVDDSVFIPFRDFVNLELPRRSALLTKGITGYDGNPNSVAAPAIIQGAPLGTWFREETASVWWRKTELVWVEVPTGSGGGGGTGDVDGGSYLDFYLNTADIDGGTYL